MTVEDQPALVTRLRDRDERALAELYDATSRRAFGLAYRVLGDGAAAEDVLQAAYLALWEQAADIDEAKGNVESLLMTIVHRRAIDAARARTRLQARSGALAHDPAADQPTPWNRSFSRRTPRRSARRSRSCTNHSAAPSS